jgi:hypothetical protein
MAAFAKSWRRGIGVIDYRKHNGGGPMKRAHIVRVLACVALSMAFFQPDAGAAPDDDILFAPKAFFDDGDISVEISGTLTGDDLPYKNNTVVVACYKDRRECLTYSIEQIARNQISHNGMECVRGHCNTRC